MKAIKKKAIPPRPIQFRPGKKLSVTELYKEANELQTDLSSYLRALVRLGRKECKVRRAKKGLEGVLALLYLENPEK